ncbi:MAG TPA: 30S ribosomal protein S6 [Clostridiaceae bacterium]|jgi:small subunit ribosomal protein S6|nr:30S ribosomal protein S6 [Clostridiaceae bacterium]
MNNYEVMFIVNPVPGEEKVNEIVEKFKNLIESQATLESFVEWGKRRLAYPINYVTEGHYVLATFSSESDFPAELERNFKITEGILRYLVIRRNKG